MRLRCLTDAERAFLMGSFMNIRFALDGRATAQEVPCPPPGET